MHHTFQLLGMVTNTTTKGMSSQDMCTLGTTTSTLGATATMLGTMVTTTTMDTTLPTTTMLCSRIPRKAQDTNDENLTLLPYHHGYNTPYYNNVVLKNTQKS